MVVNAQPYFGLLAIGLIYFCLRYALAGWARFSETIGLAAFWLYNGGLVSGYCQIFPDRLAATGCGLRARVCVCSQQRILQRILQGYRFLAMDAVSRRRGLRRGRFAYGSDFVPQLRQAAPFRPARPGTVLNDFEIIL